MSLFDVHIHADPELTRKVDEILALLKASAQKEGQMSKKLDDLQQAVTDEKTVEDSLVTAFNGLAQQIKDAGTDSAALDAIISQLKGNAATMAAAVLANTPQAPAGATT